MCVVVFGGLERQSCFKRLVVSHSNETLLESVACKLRRLEN